MEEGKAKVIGDIPSEIADVLKDLESAEARLTSIAEAEKRSFTLDGRLIGDIGEVIAARFFDIELNASQKKGNDATIMSGPNKERSVEIKCRRMSSDIEFSSPFPDYLIVLALKKGDARVELVYAGEGNVLNSFRPVLSPGEGGSSPKK